MKRGEVKPVYLVRHDRLGKFVQPHHTVKGSALFFGTADLARRWAKRFAKQTGVPTSEFSLVKFEFSGEILEV